MHNPLLTAFVTALLEVTQHWRPRCRGMELVALEFREAAVLARWKLGRHNVVHAFDLRGIERAAGPGQAIDPHGLRDLAARVTATVDIDMYDLWAEDATPPASCPAPAAPPSPAGSPAAGPAPTGT